MSDIVQQYKRILRARQAYIDDIEEKYAPVDASVSRGLLKQVVEGFTGYSIRFFEASWNTELIKSRLETEHANKKATVHVAAELNNCWQKFVCAKEMAHLIYDLPEESCVKTPDEAIRMIQNLLSESALVQPPVDSVDGAVFSERAMIIGAAELVFPFEHAVDYAQRIREGKLTPYEVAKIFEIPKVYVERFTQEVTLDQWGKLRDAAMAS